MKKAKKVLVTPISKRASFIGMADQLLLHNRKPKLRVTPGNQS